MGDISPRDDRCGKDRSVASKWDEADAGSGVALGDAFWQDRHPRARRNRKQSALDLSIWQLDQHR